LDVFGFVFFEGMPRFLTGQSRYGKGKTRKKSMLQQTLPRAVLSSYWNGLEEFQ